IARLLDGYHALDPMQRAAKVRAALALLDALKTRPAPPASALPPTPPRRAVPQFGAKPGRPSIGAPPRAEPWPPAAPLPQPPALRTQRGQAGRPPPRPAPRPGEDSLLDAPSAAVPGVGATQAARLHRLSIQTVRDLLTYYPREHRDYSKLEKIGTLPFGEICTILGMIWEVKTNRTSGGRTRTIAYISDET